MTIVSHSEEDEIKARPISRSKKAFQFSFV